MEIKRYVAFITEAEEQPKDMSVFDSMKEDVRSMIEKTIEASGGESVKSFAKNFIKNPDDVKIEGLVNDDQVYDFWLKHENEVDELLNQVDFFDESPNDLNSVGTYKYIIAAATRAVLEIVRMLAE